MEVGAPTLAGSSCRPRPITVYVVSHTTRTRANCPPLESAGMSQVLRRHALLYSEYECKLTVQAWTVRSVFGGACQRSTSEKSSLFSPSVGADS